MRTRTRLIATCGLLLWVAATLAGQRGAPAGQRPAPTNFPAQQRSPGDPTVVARGKALYDIHCRLCHGADLRGGEQDGPNLLRSQVTLNDKAGERIYPVIRDGKQTPGLTAMPALALPEEDSKAIAEYIHSVLATLQRQGGPPPGPRPVLNVLVGNAAAGQEYFAAKCSSCHSPAGDLEGIASRIPDPVQLQNFWLSGNASGPRGGTANRAMVTVTPLTGAKVEGRLVRVDDFIVIVELEDTTSQSFRRVAADNPKVEIRDPREAHRSLLPEYTDNDIHNVTAYLVTLK
jgi:cytochrome c oxidase cbb3-type subunit III